MIRRTAILLSAIGLTVMLAGPVVAGGWAQVKADAAGTTEPPREGGPAEVGFTVLQHGQTPAGWVHPVVTFTNDATGETVAATVVAEGADGHFVATASLPASGAWSWMVTTPELEVIDSPPVPMIVLTASGEAQPVDSATLLAAIEAAKADVREDLIARLDKQAGGVTSELNMLALRASRLEHDVETVTAERDALATQLAETASGGRPAETVPVLGIVLLAVLAGAAAGFAMSWLGGRPGPTIRRDPTLDPSPAPGGSSPA